MKLFLAHRKTFWADAGLFYAAAIWGSTFFIVKDALSGIDPVVLVAYRFLLAGVLLLLFLLLRGTPPKTGWFRALFLSLILWSLYISQTVGLKYTTASNAGFITGLFVLFTPLLLLVIFRRKPTVIEAVASGMSVAGLWVLTGGLSDMNVGDSLMIIAALAYALHVLYSDKYMKAGVDPYQISCQQFLLVGGLSLLTALVLDLPLSIASEKIAWIVVFLALAPTLSAFVIQMLAQRITSPVKVTLIFAFEPVFAALFAWTLGDEQIVVHRALGGLLIVLALALSGIKFPLKPKHQG
ncbi:MAG: EamA family transporter [candidate division Zixibacteria bacterium]|nr:EamA family transporter [candidate division Zixibacteria bacterium]